MLKPEQPIRSAKAIPPFAGFFLLYSLTNRYVQTAMSRCDDVSDENCFLRHAEFAQLQKESIHTYLFQQNDGQQDDHSTIK
jgi:hypothetical protein